ncbi:hypothetical protein [Neisseria sp. 83E34]|uniref:hypothetical protein n=1 Tax=Neisseria sp. 83E34 TaxID=1692264 RepID=UPI000AB72DD2|nr:hypothetical protein [Neisseria sp. 83E34]
MSFGSDFNKYYNQNMKDMGLPPVTSFYGGGITLGAGLKSLADLTNKYGTRAV